VFLLLVIAAVVIGGSFEAGEWYYQSLNKPFWTAPAWLIGPIWAVLYLMMALAAWQVWLTGHYERTNALIWWGALLVLNIVWSALFFGMHRPGWAWLELGVTIVVAVLCIKAFRPLSKQAAFLMAPYLLWIIYAWALNLATWSMNGGLLGRLLYSE
jgi:tryptophan-rich sensory protein